MKDDPRVRLFELMRNHSWSYFQLHSQQRLTTFNFYVLISSALTAGLFTALQRDDNGLVAGAIGLLLAVFSFVFRRLDGRNKELIKNGERSLRALEREWASAWPAEGPATEADVFNRDEEGVETARTKNRFWSIANRHWSFSDCFGMAFWGLGTLGAGSLALTLFLWWAEYCYAGVRG